MTFRKDKGVKLYRPAVRVIGYKYWEIGDFTFLAEKYTALNAAMVLAGKKSLHDDTIEYGVYDPSNSTVSEICKYRYPV